MESEELKEEGGIGSEVQKMNTGRELIPIALFVYNRVDHVRETVAALQLNDLNDIGLYVFSDGPREGDDLAVARVREFVETISGFEFVNVKKSEENRGLANSIISGVTEVLKHHESIIVLEDDLIVSPYFTDYMRSGLATYRNDSRVMSIAGYGYPLGKYLNEYNCNDVYFLNLTTSWGWATWRTSWKFFEKNPKKLKNEFTRADIKRFNLNNSENFWNQVLLNNRGLINTWAIFWYATVFKQNGLTLFPRISLVNNIGHDGSGTNCGRSDRFDTDLAHKQLSAITIPVEEDARARLALERFLKDSKPSLLTRCISLLKRLTK